MKSFLQFVSEDVYSLFGGDYSKVTMVFPNKRAGLFLNRHFFALADNKDTLTPHYVTIEDLFETLSPLVVADKIYLVALLHEVYCDVTGSTEPFDRFYAWGELLLSDFEDIDNSMADAKAVFSNIEDLDQLTTYDYLSDEQRSAIRQFFYVSHAAEGARLQERFQSVWCKLLDVYTEFRSRLISENLAYTAMKKREVVELLMNAEEHESVKLANDSFCFIGFGVLNKVECSLFKFIQSVRTTYFYWDYDEAYINSEAGIFVKENIRMFPNRFSGRDLYKNMQTTQKSIMYVSTSTEDAGCRYVSKWCEEVGAGGSDTRTAIVLCNEKALGAVLHAVSSMDRVSAMNVTMGYPLSDTPIFSFISALTDLQLHGRTKAGRWRYSVIATLLRHPYSSLITQGASTKLLGRMNHDGVNFPTDEYLNQTEDTVMIFEKTNGVEQLSCYILQMVTRLKMISDTLAVESVYETYTILNRLNCLSTRIAGFTPDMYSRLLLQIMRSRNIPFHGEPAVGLQIMGLLETRNLDFENIIMLSVNEGQIPKIRTNNSFIPYTLRAAHGMTTIERQNALYSYYFYRLLQRVKNITYVYNTSTEGLNRGEMSRLLLQLQLEQTRMLGPDVKICTRILTADGNICPLKAMDELKSDDEVYSKICHRFDTQYDKEYENAHHGHKMTLSPSAINEYIDCPRKFFLHYVAELKISDEMDDIDLDDATFGTMLHECMEIIYRPMIGRQLQSGQLREMASNDRKIEDIVDSAFDKYVFKQKDRNRVYNGHQLLNRHVIIKYIKRQLEYDAQNCPFVLKGIEQPVYTIIDVKGHKVRIGGVIDRSQQNSDGGLCIIDYKTSSKPQKTKSIEALFDSSKSDRAYHILQALYYCDIITELECNTTKVSAQLMYVKQNPESRAKYISIDKDPLSDFEKQFKQEYHEKLLATVDHIFTPGAEFAATKVPKLCDYCDFKALCGK